MNRLDLQSLSDSRVSDATVLLNAGHFAGAYYLLGYGVECALKACIAKQIREHEFPDRKLISDSYTHDLQQLLRLSGIKKQFDSRTRSDKRFAVNWTTTKDWTESSRYSGDISDVMAHNLFTAVVDPPSGVLPWLKTLW